MIFAMIFFFIYLKFHVGFLRVTEKLKLEGRPSFKDKDHLSEKKKKKITVLSLMFHHYNFKCDSLILHAYVTLIIQINICRLTVTQMQMFELVSCSSAKIPRSLFA